MPTARQRIAARINGSARRDGALGRPRTVVVTGASAGIGRAVAREFGSAGAHVALIARGTGGLQAAADEIKQTGGTPMVVTADVADFAAVDQAAHLIERQFGPIDVWVNAAFSTIFAPFDQIDPNEFKRATEVSYLGFVHGTMAALNRMKPRDRGTIVQVGSALGMRSIPLQSAYCGAKHAVNGFTESLRTELMHDHSNVHITVVQMPGVNTPQFSWVRSRLLASSPAGRAGISARDRCPRGRLCRQTSKTQAILGRGEHRRDAAGSASLPAPAGSLPCPHRLLLSTDRPTS